MHSASSGKLTKEDIANSEKGYAPKPTKVIAMVEMLNHIKLGCLIKSYCSQNQGNGSKSQAWRKKVSAQKYYERIPGGTFSDNLFLSPG